MIYLQTTEIYILNFNDVKCKLRARLTNQTQIRTNTIKWICLRLSFDIIRPFLAYVFGRPSEHLPKIKKKNQENHINSHIYTLQWTSENYYRKETRSLHFG